MVWQTVLSYLCIVTLFLLHLLTVAYPADVPGSSPIVGLVASATLFVLWTPMLFTVLLPN